MNMQVEKNSVVTLDYSVTDPDGELVDAGQEPLVYLHGGYDDIFPKIEEALHGKKVGESVVVKMQPDDAFGEYDADLIQVEPRKTFPKELEVGMQFEGLPEGGDDDEALQRAPVDAVLELWAGLGYYARARNLHRCAQEIMAVHGGEFPRSAAQLQSLSGIGRSTAAAIAAFAYGERAAILDGNVKRVLCRVFAIAEDVSRAAAERALWQRAESLLPAAEEMASYTQGLMDLGATWCTRRQPACARCPLADRCVAQREERQHLLPVARRRGKAPERQATFLLISDGQGVLLERRPARGIWGGLLAFPEAEAAQFLPQLGVEVQAVCSLPPLRHAFTHFVLQIMPQEPKERPANQPWPTFARLYKETSSMEEGFETQRAEYVYNTDSVNFEGSDEDKAKVKVENSTATEGFVADENGHVTGLKVVNVAPGENGPFTRQPGTERVIPADLVLISVGFLHPDTTTLVDQLPVDLDGRGNVARNDKFATSQDGVFACGDAGRGQSLVVWAISEGRSCAAAVDEYLTGSTELPAPIVASKRPMMLPR